MYLRCDSCGSGFYEPVEAGIEVVAVQCFHCGATIEVASNHAAPLERDLWTIVTADGRVLSFATRIQVETAIGAGLVRPGDRLIGGDAPSTPIERVPELQSYFLRGYGDLEQTLPYGVPIPDFGESSASLPPEAQPDSLERALLEVSGVRPPSARPSVFEPGVLDEPVMAPRRPSEPVLIARRPHDPVDGELASSPFDD